MVGKFIPLSVPNFEGNEKKYVDDAIQQGWVSTGGAYITQLEKNLSKYLNVSDTVACQSGTSALHLSLIDAGVKPGDIVLVPPVTFIAAVNPVKYVHATPIFIDCDDSLCMDPIKMQAFCEEECLFSNGILKYENMPVKAVIVVHVFGNMADMESIMKIADKYHIKVIEDATEALGSKCISGKYKGRYAGTIGDYGAYSFNGNKIITTGGGGAVTSNSLHATEHIRYLSTQAKDDPHYYIHNEVGYNYRMTNLQAALGVAQLEELPEFIIRKQRNYETYKKMFSNFEIAKLKPFRENIESNKWFYCLDIDRTQVFAPMREIITKLQNQGIGTRAIWGLINEQIPYQKEKTYKLEKAQYYADRILNIPCSTNLSEEDINYVVSIIRHTLSGLAQEEKQ